MKIVVIGGTGLIGSQTVSRLLRAGHEVVAASPAQGIDTLTGEGLDDALKGATVVVDVANSPSFEDKAVVDFFTVSGTNLLSAERTAGIAHHVALSVVGTDRLGDRGYFRGKSVQERSIRGSGIPYTIVRATQFFEFLGAIARSGVAGGDVRLPTAQLQPIASADVADVMADVALSTPRNAVIEIAGPERGPMTRFVQRYLDATRDERPVVADPEARYFGIPLEDDSLVPHEPSRTGALDFDAWFAIQPTT